MAMSKIDEYHKSLAKQQQARYANLPAEQIGGGLLPAASTKTKTSAGTSAGAGAAAGPDLTAALAALQQVNAQAKTSAEQLAAQKQQLAQNTYSENMAALEQAYRSRAEYLKANYDTALAQLQSSREDSERGVNRTVDAALQQAYVNAMKTRRDLPGQLSGMGITGGAAESTLASLQNQYQSGRNELEVTRADQLAAVLGDFQNNTASAQTSYNSQMAQEETSRQEGLRSLSQALADSIAEILSEKFTALQKADATLSGGLASLLK